MMAVWGMEPDKRTSLIPVWNGAVCARKEFYGTEQRSTAGCLVCRTGSECSDKSETVYRKSVGNDSCSADRLSICGWSLFGVIFSQLGFSNSADYTSEMFQIETENLTAVMDTYFSDAGHVASISALLADFDGSRYGTYDTFHMLPSAGTLKSLYDAVDADYNGVYEAHTQVTGEGRKPMVDADGTKVVYEGYTLVSDYDTFWSNGTYQKYFLPLIQNSCTTEDITKMENGDGSVLEADLPVLIESIPWGSWARGEDLVREETTQEVTTRAYYRYCGPEVKTFQYLDTGKRYYLDEMDQLAGIGGKTKEHWEALFQKHMENGDGMLSDGEWWQLESESVTTEKVIRYITCQYTISLQEPVASMVQTQSREYAFVTDENSLNLAIRLLRFLVGDPAPEDQGVFGFFSIAKDFLLQWSPAKIHKQMTKEDLQSINKIISWRDATASSTSFSVGGGGAILGDYTLGATAVQCALANHSTDIYSQERRLLTGFSDCSSLVTKSYQEAGYDTLYGMTAADLGQHCDTRGTALSGPGELRPGDLIFYQYGAGNGRYKNIDHVAMYAGDIDGDGAAEIIQASYSRGRVCIDKFQTNNHIVGYGRPYVAALAGSVGDENALYEYLTKTCGFSKAGACGVLANIYVESTYNPTNVTGRYYGICQWGDDRLRNMKNYCIQNGYAPDSFQGQVSFMVYELADYPELVTFLKTATDPQLAAQEFCAGYERAVDSSGAGAKYTGNLYPARRKNSYQALKKRMNEAERLFQSKG